MTYFVRHTIQNKLYKESLLTIIKDKKSRKAAKPEFKGAGTRKRLTSSL